MKRIQVNSVKLRKRINGFFKCQKDGSLGYVIKGQMVDEFEKALFDLKEGKVSKVIKTDYGYHIIKADKESDFNSEKANIKEK